MASGSVGTSPVSTSQPPRVTATSSSMRTPTFQNFFGTPRVPAGMYTPGSTVSVMPGSNTRHSSPTL
ncbi:MAG: hypothetical protein U1F06_03855 [Steroidobacteraceae bacterium]